MSEHHVLRQRILVAAVGLPLLALLLALPERPYALIVIALLACAAFELVRAADRDAPLSVPVSAGVATALLLAAGRTVDRFPIGWLLLVAAATLALLLSRGSTLGDTTAGWWIGAALYVGAAGAHFLLLRHVEVGRDTSDWLIVLLAVTFATDTGAYAVGRLAGRHLLAPSISPAKTFEGAAGGLVAGGAAAVAVPLLLDLDAPGTLLAALALAVPVAAIAGDLLESAIKRRIDVKDMSTLLPGHGGLLDRLDSLLLAGPCLYWLVRWLQA